uniref:Acyl-ACP thioesterase n=1 Tax=Ciona savignyi TaxID=51511 RepID=H2Z207_CIOSA
MEVFYTGKNNGYFDTNIMEFNRFSNGGKFSLSWWLKYTELSRQIFGSKCVRNISGEDSMDNKTMYIVRQQAQFTCEAQKFIQRVQSSDQSTVHDFPIRIYHSTSMVKNTSLVYYTKITDLTRNVELVHLVSHMVLINTATRKPISVPDAVKLYVNNLPNSPLHDISPVHDPVVNPPDDFRLFTWSRKISLLDTDYNGHANNSLYFTIPLQSLEVAMQNNYLQNHNKSVSNYVLDKYSLRIVKECHIGQVIVVTMWQSDENVFHFILTVGNNAVSYLTLWF